MKTDTKEAWIDSSLPRPPVPVNEPVRDYEPGSDHRASIAATLDRMMAEKIELPMFIDGHGLGTGCLQDVVMPHDHNHVLARAHLAGGNEVRAAIDAARAAARNWSGRHWSERASVFLKAADLLAGPWHDKLNGATMLGQSKTVHQAEIDAAAELIDYGGRISGLRTHEGGHVVEAVRVSSGRR